MLISEDKKKVSFSVVEMQIYSDANYRPYSIFDDKVGMDKYNLEYMVVIHRITFTNYNFRMLHSLQLRHS